MKKLIVVIAVVCMSTLNYAGKTFNSAVEYTDFLNGHHERLEKMFKQTHQMIKDDHTNVEGIKTYFLNLQSQCIDAIHDVELAEVYSNGFESRVAAMQLFYLYSSFGEKVLFGWLKVINNPNATAEHYAVGIKIQDDYYDELMLAEIDFDYALIDYADTNVES